MKSLLWAAAVMAVVVAYAIADDDSGVRTLWQVRAEVAASEQRVAVLRDEIASLEREADRLEDDDFAVESAIRSDLGLVRPGEQVVRPLGRGHSNPRNP